MVRTRTASLATMGLVRRRRRRNIKKERRRKPKRRKKMMGTEIAARKKPQR